MERDDAVIEEVVDVRLPIEDDEGEWTGSDDGMDVDGAPPPVTSDEQMRAAGFVTCPAGCGAWLEPRADWMTGVPELDRTAPRGAITVGDDGSALSHAHVLHRATWRFRCACGATFCAACRETPYHDGRTCEEHRAPKCTFCGDVVVSSDAPWTARSSTRAMRRYLRERGLLEPTINEKRDLVDLCERARGACGACGPGLAKRCAKKLACGHFCGGLAGEAVCPATCAACDGLDCLYCGEALRASPEIELACGHRVHLSCAAEALDRGFPGPEISFGHATCPARDGPLRHDALLARLALADGLKASVRAAARGALRADPAEKRRVAPGGDFDGRPLEHALATWFFYECGDCGRAFVGGARACGAMAEGEGPGATRRCGACQVVGRGCARGHGDAAIAWKCRYCCAEASFFCFGTTSFCSSCHGAANRGALDADRAPCRGPRHCPLGVKHPPHGVEFSLGCSLCRSEGNKPAKQRRTSFFDSVSRAADDAYRSARDAFR